MTTPHKSNPSRSNPIASLNRLIPSPPPPPPSPSVAQDTVQAATEVVHDNDDRSIKKKRVSLKRKKSPPLMGYFLTDMINSVIKAELIKHISPSVAKKKK